MEAQDEPFDVPPYCQHVVDRVSRACGHTRDRDQDKYKRPETRNVIFRSWFDVRSFFGLWRKEGLKMLTAIVITLSGRPKLGTFVFIAWFTTILLFLRSRGF